MSNFKKIVSMAIAFVMVLGLMAPAFALSSDVVGTEYEDAAAFLGALNIMVGDAESGNFRPNDSIRRSEFAKVAVLALGLESAAEAANTATQFPDVVENHWANGYINVAVGQGIMMGDAEGTFRPDADISYAEALTVLVRALGYKDSFLTGAWPANFIAKAAELNLTKGVAVNASTAATRGNVAKLLVNTLDAKVVKQTQFGDESSYEETNITLLEEKLNVDKYKDAVITAIPRVDSGLNKNEIKFTVNSNSNKFKTVDGFDYNSLLGLKADIFVNDDDEVFFVRTTDKDFTVHYDVIDKGEKVSVDEITLIKADDDFAFADNYNIYIGNKSENINALKNAVEATSGNGLFAKVVLDKNNKVVLVDAYAWNELESVVVKNVDTSAELIEYFAEDENLQEINLADGPDAYLVFNAQGKQIALEDIEKDDVIFISEADNRSTKDTEWYVFVSSEKAEGTLDKYKEDKVTVDGEEYTLAAPAATISLDDDRKVSVVDSAKLKDASDENVIVLLDFEGKARHIRTDAEETSDAMYGIVLKADTGMSDRVKIFTTEKQEVVYDVDDVDVTSFTSGNVYVVEYTLNKDGEVDSIEVLATIAADATVTSATAGSGTNVIGKSSLNGMTVDTNVVVFNLTDYLAADGEGNYAFDTDDIEIITWDEARDEEGTVNYVYRYEDGNVNNRIKAVFFTSGMEAIGDDVYAGYIVDSYKKSGDDYAKIAVHGDKVADYKVDSITGTLGDEKVVLFKLNANGVIKAGTVDAGTVGDFTILKNAKVTGKSGRYITLEGVSGQFYVPSDAVIYDEDDVKALYNVAVGEYVDIAYEGRNAVVIKIVGEEAGTVEPPVTGEYTFASEASNQITVSSNVYFNDGEAYRIRLTNLDDPSTAPVIATTTAGTDEDTLTFGINFTTGVYYKIELFQGVYSADKVIATESEFIK